MGDRSPCAGFECSADGECTGDGQLPSSSDGGLSSAAAAGIAVAVLVAVAVVGVLCFRKRGEGKRHTFESDDTENVTMA